MLWFKHDADASIDAKVKKLLLRHGAIGYAVYFHCIELIVSDISESNITFELEHDAEIIADNLKIKGTTDKAGVDIVNEVMRYIVELGLFEECNGHITCYKILKRLDTSMTSNERLRKTLSAAKAKNHDEVMMGSCQNHDEVMMGSCQNHDEVRMRHDKVMQEEKRRDKKREDSITSISSDKNINTDIHIGANEEKKQEETASPSTAVAVRAKRPVSKRVDMSDEEKALYHWVEDSFKKVPGSEALMYKDRAASARTGATIKVIVERCMNHAKGGGDPAIIARAMLETFYRAVKENEMNPKKGIEGPFIPTRLMTDWIWDKVFADCVSKSEQSDEAEIDRINRIAAETKAKMDAAKKERAYAR